MDFNFWNTQSDIELKTTQLSVNSTSFNLPRNISIIEEGIIAAGQNNSDLLLTDEMNMVGYDSGDDFQYSDNETIYDRLVYLAQRAQAANPNMLVTVGHPWRLNLDSLGLDLKNLAQLVTDPQQLYKDPIVNRHGLPFNVMSVLGQGRVLAMSAKTHLFSDERGHEKRYFPEWATSSPVIKAMVSVSPPALTASRTAAEGLLFAAAHHNAAGTASRAIDPVPITPRATSGV